MVLDARAQVEETVLIPAGEADLTGILSLPENPCGVVLVAEDQSVSPFSGRRERLAARLRTAGLGTLTIDLLSKDEAALHRPAKAVVSLMAERLLEATRWIRALHYGLPVGYLGAGAAGAAALEAASQAPHLIEAVVCLSGLPVIPRDTLEEVKSPTLWLLGADDPGQYKACQAAFDQLACAKAMELVPGAGPRFDEGSTLDRAANAARHWFIRHLAGIGTHRWRTVRR